MTLSCLPGTYKYYYMKIIDAHTRHNIILNMHDIIPRPLLLIIIIFAE